MNKARRLWSLAIAGLVAAAFTFVLQPTAISKKPPKETVIKGCGDKKPPVKFPHAKHVKTLKEKGMKCKTCHHKKGKVKTCSTKECHGKPQKGLKTCSDKSMKKNPFHKQCVGCHKKLKKGPKKCKECHKK